MWKYAGVKDSTRCSNEELSLKEVTDAARKLSKLSKEETFVVDPAIVPYSKENPIPKVRTTSSLDSDVLDFDLLFGTFLWTLTFGLLDRTIRNIQASLLCQKVGS